MPRVLICDKLEAAGLDILARAGFDLDNRPGLKGPELAAALQAADGAVVRSGTRLTGDLLDSPGKLRCVVRAGVGVDNIDVPAATRRGVIVMNTPSGNTVSAAEHTIALLLAVARHVPAADASMKAGKWDRNKFLGTQVAGKTLGVIGLGRIGREVAQRAVTVMPSPFARWATSRPIRPRPTTPSVLPATWVPTNLFRSHPPPLTVACASGTR